MILLLPVAVKNIPPEPQRSTPVIWIWLALVISLFTIERAVMLNHDLGLHLLPAQLFDGVTFVVASWSCYSDSSLFAPWQLWSYVLVHDSWWQLGIEVAIMLVIGRSLERVMGSLAMGMALLTLAPMSATLFLLFGGADILIGGHGLCLSLLGLAAGRLPRAVIQWGLSYWIIVAVGFFPLFVLALPTMIILYVAMVVSLAPAAAAFSLALWAMSCVLVGILIGIAGPRFMHHHQTT